MIKEFGNTIRELRKRKDLTGKELCQKCGNIFTTQQLSNIENGIQFASAEKLMIILSALNVKYDEFLFLMNDPYISSKYRLEKLLSEYVKLKNVEGLEKLVEEAAKLFAEYQDSFFTHIHSMALAMISLLRNDYSYELAKGHLLPIEEYLNKIKTFSYYEITLVGQCLFIFDIEKAIQFGERSLTAMEAQYTFYKNDSDGCVLMTNLAIYCLNYEEYWHLSLKYAQMSSQQAATANDATRSIHAQIIHQIACFKLKNSLYNKGFLISLIESFKVIGWEIKHDEVKRFVVEKHGIIL